MNDTQSAWNLQLLKHITYNNVFAYAVIDYEFTILSHSDNLALWGVNPSESLSTSYLPDIFPELIGQEHHVQQLSATELFTLTQVHRSGLKGEDRYINLHIQPLFDKPDRLVVQFFDVTTETNLSKQLKQERNELRLAYHKEARLVTELQASKVALQEAKQNAEAASQAKSDFLASMSHELRTPLNSILGYTQLLQQDTNLTKRQVQAIETMQISGEHLLLLINDVLDISKIEAGKMSLSNTETALPHFLQTITDIVRVQAEERSLLLTTNFADTLPYTIHIDEKRLRQVLLNLLGNAIKFTPAGQITFSVSMLTHHHATATLRFEIEDTGIGIPAEAITRIFELFEQAHQHEEYEGTGLGLSISQRIVRLMGGLLQVRSEEGEGSCFWFDLPITDFSVTSTATPNQSLFASPSMAEFKLPPQATLSQLYQAALEGDIMYIQEHVTVLSSEYTLFTHQLAQLADAFDLEAIQSYLLPLVE